MHFLLHILTNKFLGVEATSVILLLAELLAIFMMPSILIKRRGQPLSALAWLLAVFSLPFIGVLFWWTFGRTHMKRVQKFKRIREKTFPDGLERASKSGFMSEIISPSLLEENHTGIFTPTGTNQVKVYSSGLEYFTELEEAIKAAQKEINLLYYIWKTDNTGKRIRDLLIQKSKEGIAVRIIVDNVGSLGFLGPFSKPLRDAGVKVSGFLPLRFWPWAPSFNFRNHRKLLCVDGRISFIGGINIGDEYKNDWRDVAVRVLGPASQQLEKVFLEDWTFSKKENVEPLDNKSITFNGIDECAIIASGPDCKVNCSHDVLFQMISIARNRVWIQTPYFIPPSSITAALRAAVLRGVDVKVMLPEKNDVKIVRLASRSFYPALLESGISIYEYSKSMLHSKVTIVDDYALVGSSNIDSRSFRLNFELGCLVKSSSAVQDFTKIFSEDLSYSVEVNRADIQNLSKWSQVKGSFAHLLSPLI